MVSFTGSLEEPPEMNRALWALPLVVKLQVQMLHRKHDNDNTIFSDNMQRNSRLGIPDFLSGPLAFLQVAKHPHISDWGKYAVLVERSSDIQELIRHMFPSLLEEFHYCAMAMNLAVGVTSASKSAEGARVLSAWQAKRAALYVLRDLRPPGWA
jgi:hypothetical protein